MEALVEGSHASNFVSLIGPDDPDSKPLFKWNNSFGWAYTGNVADSLKDLVEAAGGRTNVALRFSHSWNRVGRNASLMDLHVFMPGSSAHSDGMHDRYPTGQRVGWNNRQDSLSGGTQDVDYVSAAPEGYVPVENIVFPTMSKLRDGKYIFKIHNWQLRNPTNSGVTAEIAFGGQIFTYEIARPLANKEWVTVAEATLKNGKFTIEHKIPHGESTREIWGIQTNQFHPVTVCMQSPNFWDAEHGTGHRHYFFMLKDCVNSESPNGFYNEFLCNDLQKHRNVFEALGAKESVKVVDDQLSGIGFSATKRASLIVKVSGSFTRNLKIIF
jgi:hypothetical protein